MLEEMLKEGYNLGGEQSGHIIFSKFAKTGDGILTAVQLLSAMVKNNKRLSELGALMTKYRRFFLTYALKTNTAGKKTKPLKPLSKNIRTNWATTGRYSCVRPAPSR